MQHRIECPSDLNLDTGRELFDQQSFRAVQAGDECLIDLANTERMDPQGGAWLIRIAEEARTRNATVQWEGGSGQVGELMTLIEPGLLRTPPPKDREPGYLEQVGGITLDVFREAGEMFNLLIDTIYWTVLAPFEGRGFRWGHFIDEIHDMGAKAVRITFLMNFLLGLTIAMLSAAQMRNFGLTIFVSQLIVIGFARELAAVMTAVVVSARTGAAITAEISTMVVQEEIDALRGMGLNVTQFLVAPKMLALIVVLPCLTALGMVSGILGGLCWGVWVLGFRPEIWLTESLNAARWSDISQGLTKSFFFAILIVLIGCHNGLRVTGGSRGSAA
jgi:phospholipid/cholesterol/gamma-HCH transport system permease protein